MGPARQHAGAGGLAMEYRRLGRSGLRVSRIALGCMSYGDPALGAHPWTLGMEEAHRLIAQALDLGINFFDTANIYSLGTSEEILGGYIKSIGGRDRVVFATKVYEAMGESPLAGGLSRQAICYEVDQSLRRLQTDYIDLYIIHRWDYATPIEETLSALHDLIKAGKVRYIGASSMHAWQFVKAQYVADLHGWSRFVSMQSHYNLLNREEEREMLPYCLEEGVGITPWSPLARGKLARPDGLESARMRSDPVQTWLYDSAVESDRRILSEVAAVAAERGEPPARIALAWLLAQPGVAAPIVGATRDQHLVDAMAALDIRLDPAEISRLEQPYAPHATPEYR